MPRLRLLPFFLPLLCGVLASPAYGDVPLRGTRISVSSAAGAWSDAGMAGDNDPLTRWEAASPNAGEWIAIDFASTTRLTALRVSEVRPRIRGYRVDVLQQGGWRMLLRGNGIPPMKLDLPPTWAEGVRLVTTAASDGAPAIAEFAAWGAGTSPCTPQAGLPSVIVVDELDCAGLTIGRPCGMAAVTTPLFVIRHGGRLRNATLIDSYVLCEGSCALDNVHWRNNCTSWPNASALVQSESPVSGRHISVANGSAFGRFGALFHVQTPDARLSLRQFSFSGYGETLNGYTPDNAPRLRLHLEDLSIAGTLRGGIALVRAHVGDRATLRNLRIFGYQPGTPIVCHAFHTEKEALTSLGEQWNTTACDVSPEQVAALPP